MALLPSKEDRDRHLDELKAAAQDWFAKEEARIDNETKFLRSVLAARGANNAAALNLDEAVKKVLSEVDAYLLVSPTGR